MTINMKNPIGDLRKLTGYDIEKLSLVSGLTVNEIERIEKGELIDPAVIARLFAAAGVKQAD